MQIDWPATAQMLTAEAAIAALFIAPIMTRANERRARKALSTDAWLNQLRIDVAELLSIYSQLVLFRSGEKSGALMVADETAAARKADELAHRVMLSLSLTDESHVQFDNALEALIKAKNITELQAARREVNSAFANLAGRAKNAL